VLIIVLNRCIGVWVFIREFAADFKMVQKTSFLCTAYEVEPGFTGERANIRSLADQLKLPIAALTGDNVQLAPLNPPNASPKQPFDAEAHEYHFADDLEKIGSQLKNHRKIS